MDKAPEIIYALLGRYLSPLNVMLCIAIMLAIFCWYQFCALKLEREKTAAMRAVVDATKEQLEASRPQELSPPEIDGLPKFAKDGRKAPPSKKPVATRQRSERR